MAEYLQKDEYIEEDTYETIEMVKEREKEKAEETRVKVIRKQ